MVWKGQKGDSTIQSIATDRVSGEGQGAQTPPHAVIAVPIDVVCNPASGQFRRPKLERLMAALRRNGFAPRLIESRPDGVTLSADARIVCVHGGDGTLRQVAHALGARLARVPLCISPCGTINLVARELGYSTDPEAFAAELAARFAAGEESWLRSPLVTCGAMPVVACFSAGPDSAAVAALDPVLKKRIGRYAYPAAAIGLLRRWPRQSFGVEAELPDGSVLRAQAQAAFVARGRFYAGPFRLSRKAGLETDTFELILLPRAGRLAMAGFALALALGLPVQKLGLARILSARRAAFDTGRLPVQVDGDAFPGGPLTIAMSGQSVLFCV